MATNYLAKLTKINNAHENKLSRVLKKAQDHKQHCLELLQMAIKDYQDAVAQLQAMTKASWDSTEITEGIVADFCEELDNSEDIDFACEDLFNLVDGKFNGTVVDSVGDDDADDETIDETIDETDVVGE